MTLKERDAADREDAATQPSLHEGDMGLDGAGDTKDDGVMRNAREVMRNRDGTPMLASASLVKKKQSTFGKQMKKLAPLREKDNKQSNMKNLVGRSEELAADEGQDSGRGTPRKHGTPAPEAKLGRGGASKLAAPEGTPAPAVPLSRKIGRSKTIRRTIEADYDTDESSSKSGRRSPHKHSGTPVPGSRSGTPRSGITVKNAMDSNQKLKRVGSNLTQDLGKTRRTISPERKECFPTEPSTPERNVRLPDQDKTPVVEITAFDPDANFHKALTSPVKKATKSFGNANNRSGTPSRQPQSPSISANIAAAFQTPTKAGSRSATPTPQRPLNSTNTASAFKVKPAVQNVSPLKKVGKHARSLPEALESPERGKRSRTGTPRTTPPKIGVEDDDSFLSELGGTPSPVKKSSPLKMAAPPNNTTLSKKDKSSSFLSPLEDTPSPPPVLQPKPRLVNGAPFTNGRSSQSRRTVVEDTDAESSEDSDDDLPMAFHNPRAVASIPCIPALVATTSRKGILPVPGKDRKYKFSLKNLVASMADNERTNEIAAKVTKMMAEKDALLKNPSKSAPGTVTPHDGHAKLLQDVVTQHSAEAGGNDAQKVLKALKRANVTQGDEMVYHFFESGEPKKMKNKREYPKYVLHLLDKEGPNKIWHEMFASRETREMGLRDGLYAEMVAVDKGMGEAMFYWVLDQLAKESNATLRNGYLAMLLNAPVSILGHFTPDTVRRHFKTLGARREALVANKQMVLELEPVQESVCLGFTSGDHWGGLIDFLELLGRTAILLSFETREYALGVILRLCADKVIRAHISIEEGVQKALMLLSEAFETEEEWEMVVSTRITPDKSKSMLTSAVNTPIPNSLHHHFHHRPPPPHLLIHPLPSPSPQLPPPPRLRILPPKPLSPRRRHPIHIQH